MSGNLKVGPYHDTIQSKMHPIEWTTRMLIKEEVGEAMVHSLRRDVDGSVYLVYPDMPLIEVPDSGPPLIKALYAIGKVGTALGKDSLSKKEVQVILLVLLYIGFYVLHNILILFLSFLF